MQIVEAHVTERLQFPGDVGGVLKQLQRLGIAAGRDLCHIPDNAPAGIEIGGAHQQQAPLGIFGGDGIQQLAGVAAQLADNATAQGAPEGVQLFLGVVAGGLPGGQLGNARVDRALKLLAPVFGHGALQAGDQGVPVADLLAIFGHERVPQPGRNVVYC